jgi:hypothetical protein
MVEGSGKRPVAFIQVDLDGLWAVRRCYGVAGSPEQDDPVYSHALPALLELFDRLGIQATFFVVGADAQVTWKCRQLEAVVKQGHEIANHSMRHDLSLGLRDADYVEREVTASQAALGQALGVEPHGFRAPGYGFSSRTVEVLRRLNFWYDSSLLPTPWGGLMRWLDWWMSRRPGSEKSQYGSMRGWRAPFRPYHPDPGRPEKASSVAPEFWEIPVSVSRLLRLPFHGATGYLLGRRWVDRAVRTLTRKEGFLNYVFHGLDLVDGRSWPVTPTKRGRWLFAGGERPRLDFFDKTLRQIVEQCEIQRTDRWVEARRTSVEKPLTG